MMILLSIVEFSGFTLVLMWVPVELWLILHVIQAMPIASLVEVAVGSQMMSGGSLLGLCMMLFTMTP